MDFNWHFSALAQSAAAIVALVSAFLVTKVISSEAAFTRGVTRVQDMLHSSLEIRDRASGSAFARYNKGMADLAVAPLRTLLEEDGGESPAEDYVRMLHLSEYMSWSAATEFVEEQVPILLEQIRERKRKSRNPLTGVLQATDSLRELTQDMTFGPDARDDREVEAVTTEVLANTRRVKSLLGEIRGNPQQSSLVMPIVVAVLVLLFVSVIGPLALLPQPDTGFDWGVMWPASRGAALVKWLGLLVLSAAFVFIMGVVVRLNGSLVYDSDMVSELDVYAKAENYSEYFAAYVDNRGKLLE